SYYTYHFPVLCVFSLIILIFSFFFQHPPPPEIYTLSLHDALPIYADCYQYFCVPEYGTANGRLHFHAVHFMRTLPTGSVDHTQRSEERFSRNAETDLVCRLLLEKKKKKKINHLHTT